MKNKLIFSFVFVFAAIFSYGQTTDSLPSVLKPEKTAEFKGGLSGWSRFLEKNLDPDLLRKNGAPAGRYMVIGNFLVDSLGKVSDIRIVKDPGYGAADEFIRILKLSSKNWIPAQDQGKPVPYRHMQSLTLIN